MPELGIGWYPVTANPYDDAYFEKYLGYDETPVGALLTKCRIAMVRRFYRGDDLIDVGIGGGRFVREIDGWGFDVNRHAVAYLRTEGRYRDPRAFASDAATFWDSLEHIHEPAALLRNVRRFAFVSLPIFEDCYAVLRSKHFRRDEHCWYFTRHGLKHFMSLHGFKLVEHNTMEQDAGREQIESFAFRRIN